jgi:two-component system chemotaxis sensor kinase CheA
MSMDDAIAAFRAEAGDLFERLERALLDLATKPGDRALIDEVFRALHTLKGSGAMFGFDALADFTHECETAFDRVRKGQVEASPQLVGVVLEAQDHMRALLESPETVAASAGDSLLERLALALDAAGGAQGAAALGPSTLNDDLGVWRMRFALPPNAVVNGANPALLLAELGELGAIEVTADLEPVPPLDQLVASECRMAWNVTLASDCPRTAIEDVFLFLLDDMQLDLRREPAAPCRTDETVAEDPADPIEGAPRPGDEAADASEVRAAARGQETMRVPAERLDELMDRVGELVIAQSRLTQLANASSDINLRAVAEDIERLSAELRGTMMVLRMTPVGSLFGRFRRLVHDLARETGKAIDLSMEGEATEVDKTVIERLADPLIHLIRNAADHGLESAEDRRAAGKPEAGRIRLSARQAGGEVIITVSDDGRGIDRARVRAKAESQGLIEPGATLADSELLHLIFHPGFSTAKAVTSLSGRGVGMDVVKRAIEALRGSIDIVSREGEGSEISLRIPLTLAIIDGLLVRVGKGRYVIPLSAVEECLELPLDEDLRSQGRSFISLRDSLVPFLRLRDLFATGTSPELHQKIVVVSTGAERVGLVVDQIIGDHQTVIKSLSKLHEQAANFSGATILGDGAVALILDIAQLVSAGQKQEAHMRAAG